MQVKKSIYSGSVDPLDEWFVIVCSVLHGNRIIESHFTEEGAIKAADICNKHDHFYGHENQYVVRHKKEIEII